MTDAEEKEKVGHRQRMRQRFLAGEELALTEEFMLELLLTYAIPQRDVQPLAKNLLSRFGSLMGVLEADTNSLCATDGIKDSSAVLIKLVNLIHKNGEEKSTPQRFSKAKTVIEQPALFKTRDATGETPPFVSETFAKARKTSRPRRGTGLFGKAVLKEAIEMSSRLPDSESVDEVRYFLRHNLHFSAEQTRRRYADYIAMRLFPSGHADHALRAFARRYEGRQELRDVCFYRFCKAEPVMYKVVNDLFIPSIGAGRLSRERLRDYLAHEYPSAKSIKDSAQAITEALAQSGVAKADRAKITFGYREILLPSFAFVVHDEFPEPGMYPIEQLENSTALRAMFWNPDRVLGSLYELRNQGLIAKVSEIDAVRQFTTRWGLDQVVERLVGERAVA